MDTSTLLNTPPDPTQQTSVPLTQPVTTAGNPNDVTVSPNNSSRDRFYCCFESCVSPSLVVWLAQTPPQTTSFAPFNSFNDLEAHQRAEHPSHRNIVSGADLSCLTVECLLTDLQMQQHRATCISHVHLLFGRTVIRESMTGQQTLYCCDYERCGQKFYTSEARYTHCAETHLMWQYTPRRNTSLDRAPVLAAQSDEVTADGSTPAASVQHGTGTFGG